MANVSAHLSADLLNWSLRAAAPGEVLSVDEMLCRYARSENRECKRAPTAHRSGFLSL